MYIVSKNEKTRERKKKTRKNGRIQEKTSEKTYLVVFFTRLEPFPPRRPTFTTSDSICTSSGSLSFLLRRVFRRLGGSLGSDSPRLRVFFWLAVDRVLGFMTRLSWWEVGRGLAMWKKAAVGRGWWRGQRVVTWAEGCELWRTKKESVSHTLL